MRTTLTVLFITFFNSLVVGQTDPLKIFYAHKFPCDTGGKTYDINFCSGVKRNFADSLLNLIYNNVINSLDNEIADDKSKLKIEQSKSDSSLATKENIQFWNQWIDYNQRLKESIIKSQNEWINMKDLNQKVIRISSEGGTGFVSAENQSLIDDTLDRIKKLKTFYYIDYK